VRVRVSGEELAGKVGGKRKDFADFFAIDRFEELEQSERREKKAKWIENNGGCVGKWRRVRAIFATSSLIQV
jgi:hypothetical protein